MKNWFGGEVRDIFFLIVLLILLCAFFYFVSLPLIDMFLEWRIGGGK